MAGVWAGAAGIGLIAMALRGQSGWSSGLTLVGVGVAALGAVLLLVFYGRSAQTDWQALAREVEARYPELDGRLVTALEQQPGAGGELSFLQERLLTETLHHSDQQQWADAVPQKHVWLAQAAQWLALAMFCSILLHLRTTGGFALLRPSPGSSLTVTPGDTSLERGSTLVVLTRFTGPLPPLVDLVVGRLPGASQRVHLVKSLADPMFGGSVPEISSNLSYHVEYAGHRTREFQVKVFEHPRLERADATLVWPAYTKKPVQRIENTRRISAVEGSRLALDLHFNKPVASARLVPRDKAQSPVSLLVESNKAGASLKDFPLETSRSYELEMLDAEGRTNKVPSLFVFEVTTNRRPEVRLTWPHGDLRPSPLEEINFQGTVWDDFGVEAYGLGVGLAGQETKTIELGRAVPGQEKRPFQHLLRLEDLGVRPDELLSWFVWADDLGPDGQLRRTTTDLFFGEVRPFEEIFRQGQGMDASSGEQAQSGQQTGRLIELQKQIISATWKLEKERGGSGKTASGAKARSDRSLSNIRVAALEMPTSGGSSGPRLRTRLAALAFGQLSPAATATPLLFAKADGQPATFPTHAPSYSEDAAVVRDSQAQALEQARASAEGTQDDPRVAGLWSGAIKQMEQALSRLRQASNSAASLPEALAAEQAAYQNLLRLQEHEYSVVRSRNQNQRGNARGQQMQQQLEQLDFKDTENRYETQRQAQGPPTTERREQLQAMSRLQELARRQQDLNDRLKELQTALQEARTEQERADIQHRLKRLEEEEQQMLADVDELRQRMDRPENQSQMSEERRQLDQTREDVDRAAQAAAQGEASQALAAGTRAQRQLQQLRDQLRQESSSQFSEDLRDLRAQARQLARQQEDVAQQMLSQSTNLSRSLASDGPSMLDRLNKQKERLTNVLDRATQLSEQAEDAEPLLSRQLYDSVRKFTQDSGKAVQEAQDQLLDQGLMTHNLYDELKASSEPDGAKLLELTSEMVRRDFTPQANEIAGRSRANIDQLKRGVEQAAESVLGDDTEALRLAQQELKHLTEQLQQEAAEGTGGAASNQIQTARGGTGNSQPPHGLSSTNRSQSGQSEAPGEQASLRNPNRNRDLNRGALGEQPNASGQDPNSQIAPERESSSGSGRELAQAGGSPRAREGELGADGGPGPEGVDWGGYGRGYWDRWLSGPITGTDFLPWSERLRDVEEMIEQPDWRNAVAAARERARVLRQGYKHDAKKPDWAVVRLQVMQPLIEVQQRIADELARRQSTEALVPIDRDPVPNRYSELVRRYYEELGK